MQRSMNIYFAPMEGVTTRVYRDVHRAYFGGADRYYTPFLTANQTHKFKKRETAEFTPYQEDLVPQLLCGKAEDFIWGARHLAEAGYQEVNFNLGCPAATVFTKRKGAGMLADPEALDRFFSGVFEALPDGPAISVKMRIGVKDPAEAQEITKVICRYPFSEVIIHPRVREEFYEGRPHIETFRSMNEMLSGKAVYNGDLCNLQDLARFRGEFPGTQSVMIGRGLIADPALARAIRQEDAARRNSLPAGKDTAGRNSGEAGEDAAGRNVLPAGADASGPNYTVAELAAFLDALWKEYSAILYGERDVLFKMKELWYYLGRYYTNEERALLDLKKAKNRADYDRAVHKLLTSRTQ